MALPAEFLLATSALIMSAKKFVKKITKHPLCHHTIPKNVPKRRTSDDVKGIEESASFGMYHANYNCSTLYILCYLLHCDCACLAV